MQNFYLLKIQNEIEVTRLVWGQRLEKFLFSKIKLFLQFFAKVLNSKKTSSLGILLIAAISILIQSNRDVGHDSATYIEIAQKMLAGGKYYQDFFELNFPLSFWLTLIPTFLAKILEISPIITVTIFVNLLGILSVFYSKNILEKRFLPQNSNILNIIILSYAASFFLRPITLHFNELFTKASYFLILLFPYFSYQILENRNKFQEAICGILAGLIFCLKPNYGIVVIIFELTKLAESRNLRKSFCFRNYLTLVVLVVYFLAIFFFQKDYIEHFLVIYQTYLISSHNELKTIIREDIFPLALLTSLCFFLFRKNILLRKFYLLTFAAILIVCSELIGGYDQRFVIYSCALATIFLSIYFLIQEESFNLKKHSIWLIFILLISQFDAKSIFNLALDLPAFYFVFVAVLHIRNKDKISPFYFAVFLLLTSLTIILFFNHKTEFFAWLISAILFIFVINFYQRKISYRKFSLLSASIIILVLSYVLSIYIASIFNIKAFHEISYGYKSPNTLNEEMIKIAKTSSLEKDDVTVIGYIIPATYPAMLYINKQNKLPQLNMVVLFKKIGDDNQIFSDGEKYLFSRLKQQLQNSNNKLVYVEVGSLTRSFMCEITFLEYYLRDPEFKEIFLKNYKFLNRIISVEKGSRKAGFYKEESDQIEDQKFSRIIGDIEVYVRK